jgi:hypothetical protein
MRYLKNSLWGEGIDGDPPPQVFKELSETTWIYHKIIKTEQFNNSTLYGMLQRVKFPQKVKTQTQAHFDRKKI